MVVNDVIVSVKVSMPRDRSVIWCRFLNASGALNVVEPTLINSFCYSEPLIIKNAEKNAVVGELEFTYYRLCGLVAAYVFDERHRFPTINSSEANVLGLTWHNKDEEMCRMYLSAVSGSQDHYDQFSFWPLICSLRKLHLKKTKLKSVLIFAKIKNDEGKTMAELFKHNYEKAECLWTLFPNATLKELIELKKLLPDWSYFFVEFKGLSLFCILTVLFIDTAMIHWKLCQVDNTILCIMFNK